LHSDEDLTESSWGPGFPNEDPGNADDCGVMVVGMDSFWWEDSSCFAPEVQHNTVAVICQYDIAVASTTTTIAASTTANTAASTTTNTATFTTTSRPEPTTVTITTAVTGSSPGDSCPSGWQEFGGHCYLLLPKIETWENAEMDCYSKGGHLASVHSAAENAFIHNLQPYAQLWLGATDAAVEVVTHIQTYKYTVCSIVIVSPFYTFHTIPQTMALKLYI
jgi:hypothetical protein